MNNKNIQEYICKNENGKCKCHQKISIQQYRFKLKKFKLNDDYIIKRFECNHNKHANGYEIWKNCNNFYFYKAKNN